MFRRNSRAQLVEQLRKICEIDMDKRKVQMFFKDIQEMEGFTGCQILPDGLSYESFSCHQAALPC